MVDGKLVKDADVDKDDGGWYIMTAHAVLKQILLQMMASMMGPRVFCVDKELFIVEFTYDSKHFNINKSGSCYTRPVNAVHDTEVYVECFRFSSSLTSI